MEPDLPKLRENYERFSDDKLISLATQEASLLRPEALELLKKIITERGLVDDIEKAVNAQFRQVDESTIDIYCDLLRNLSCPFCKSSKQRLNISKIASSIGLLIITTYREDLVIACPDCLDKQIDEASRKTWLMGWWSLPMGFIRAVGALSNNSQMKDSHRKTETSFLFKSFVKRNAARIAGFENNPEQLNLLISHP